ncbi:MAG TPA: hypothetical protein DCM87_22520 [Planctomycetes bacterium]|nr:hypothetical protein [Planctomycetota bacterium]
MTFNERAKSLGVPPLHPTIEQQSVRRWHAILLVQPPFCEALGRPSVRSLRISMTLPEAGTEEDFSRRPPVEGGRRREAASLRPHT